VRAAASSSPPPDGFTTILFCSRGRFFRSPPVKKSSRPARTDPARRTRDSDRRRGDLDLSILRPEALSSAVLQRRPADIDVHALHHGYLRRFRANGGALCLGSKPMRSPASVKSGASRPPAHLPRAGRRERRRRMGGAALAAMAGAVDVDLQPLKRTACLIEPPPSFDIGRWPMLKDARERFYLKPDAGKLLLSPCDETPTPPSDPQADELDVAIAVDRVERATTLQVRRCRHRWAGLRSFVADRSPVVGFDPLQPGFFWLRPGAATAYRLRRPSVASPRACLRRRRSIRTSRPWISGSRLCGLCASHCCRPRSVRSCAPGTSLMLDAPLARGQLLHSLN